MFFETAISAFFTALIFILIVSFAVRYRRGTKVDRSNPPTANFWMEVSWFGVPLVIGMVMFVWGAVLYRLYDPPSDAMEVYVVGKQWMREGAAFRRASRDQRAARPPAAGHADHDIGGDVIHSFYIPAFRTKQDVLPGRNTSMWFEPTQVGRYHLFCAEYCGTNHSAMGGWVYVMEPTEFQQWLASRVRPSMADQGERLFVQYHCAGCHRGSQVVKAPQLEGVYGRPVPIQQGNEVRFTLADDRYIRDSILEPKKEVVAGYQPLMPPFKDQIKEEDLFKIIAYIKSIGAKEATR